MPFLVSLGFLLPCLGAPVNDLDLRFGVVSVGVWFSGANMAFSVARPYSGYSLSVELDLGDIGLFLGDLTASYPAYLAELFQRCVGNYLWVRELAQVPVFDARGVPDRVGGEEGLSLL